MPPPGASETASGQPSSLPVESPGAVPAGTPATGGGLDPLVIGLLAVIALLILVIGILLGSRRAARRSLAPDQPSRTA